jgi:hypothetical protein
LEDLGDDLDGDRRGGDQVVQPISGTNEDEVFDTPTSVFTSSELGMPMPSSIKDRYEEDSFFKHLIANPAQFKEFEEEDGLLYLNKDGCHVLCIPDINIGTHRLREILIKHAHSVLAHLGKSKTLTYLREEVWWKTMVNDVAEYCKSCAVCATSKSAPQQPMGLLRTLPIPWRPWQYIALDFVGPLPQSSNRLGKFDMICVTIDQLTSMVHLVPTQQSYGAKQLAEVIFENIYKLHSLPER